jgi:hypothetical protein
MSDSLKNSNSHALNQILESRLGSMVDRALKVGEDKEQQLESAIVKTIDAVISMAESGDLGDDFGDPGWIAAVAVQFFGIRRLASLSRAQIESLILEMLVSIDPNQLFSDLLAGPTGIGVLTGTRSAGRSAAIGRLAGKATGQMAALGVNVASSGFSIAYSLAQSAVTGGVNLNHRPVAGNVKQSYSMKYSDISLKVRVRMAQLVRSLNKLEDIPSRWRGVRDGLIAPGNKAIYSRMPNTKSLNDVIKES